MSVVAIVALGEVRATTFIAALGCFSAWGTTVDGKGKTTSSMRKKPGKRWSRNCLSESRRLSYCASTTAG